MSNRRIRIIITVCVAFATIVQRNTTPNRCLFPAQYQGPRSIFEIGGALSNSILGGGGAHDTFSYSLFIILKIFGGVGACPPAPLLRGPWMSSLNVICPLASRLYLKKLLSILKTEINWSRYTICFLFGGSFSLTKLTPTLSAIYSLTTSNRD